MQPTILHSSPLSAGRLVSVKFLHLHHLRHHKKKHFTKLSALRSGGYDDGKLIDQNMIVLRKRIQEIKIIDSSNEAASEWMEWEKKYYYANYNSHIYEAVRILQSVLMNTRPSLALAMLVLFMLSVPTSFLMIMFNLCGWINGFYL